MVLREFDIVFLLYVTICMKHNKIFNLKPAGYLGGYIILNILSLWRNNTNTVQGTLCLLFDSLRLHLIGCLEITQDTR